ncbi:MAG: SIMPL domain-containing protein [Hyphomicrobiales bacterium]|jgi:uncharacterized protein YggE
MSFASSRLLLAISFIAFMLTLGAIAKTAVAQELPVEPLAEATITVTGHGTLNAEPDIAVVNAGAVSEARTAREALDANTKVMADAFAALREMGVEERDMQTSRLTVEPRYTYFDSSNGERRPPRIDGYTVSNQLTVRVRDLSTIGEALDALITAGVNQMGGLSFAVDEPNALFAQARQSAVADAIEQAQMLTEAAGVSLGRVISISQNNARQQPPQPQMTRMAMVMESADAIPVATGEQELSAQVTITWAIDNGTN